MPMQREWNGDLLAQKINRAAGRAIVGVAMAAAVETKRYTHVQFGDLRRSIHAAPVNYDGSADEDEAKKIDMMMTNAIPNVTRLPGLGPAVEVGSWMPYACVEWIGRGHPGVTEGIESIRGARCDSIVRQAFREEGLI